MKARLFCARAASFLLFTLLATFTVFSQNSDLRNDLNRSFTKFDVVRVNAGRGPLAEGGDRTLSLQAAGKQYDLVVKPNDLRSSRYRAEDTNLMGVTRVATPAVNTFKGKIAGSSTSEVRLTIDGDRVEGFFQDEAGRLFIEPAKKYSPLAEPGESVIYRAEDSLKDNTVHCDTDLPGKLELGRGLAGIEGTENDLTLRILELATDADAEWVTRLGGAANTNSDIMGVLNMVEGTYNGELNLSIRVVYQHTWSAADPYAATDMPGILNRFVDHWNANFGTIARDAAHLFSGKTAALSRGLAYLGVICRAPSVSYGVSGYVGWTPGKFLVPAHEIGHNLGADHAELAQNCGNTLMNASLAPTTALSFCTFSRNSITNYVASNSSCLSETSTPPSAGSAPFDFDADGRSDVSVFRPSTGVWYMNRSTSGFTAFQFGLNGDKPVTADFDGDNRADAAVFRDGLWYRTRSSTSSTDVINFGLAGDIPAPADFDGDGKADVGVFRPATGTWYWLGSSTGSSSAVRFGLPGDVPLPADYDGDGRDDINLFRPATGTWYRLNSSNGSFFAMNFGLPGDVAVTGDFDGDSVADVAVWRPSSGVWYVMRSATGGMSAGAFGLAGDIPTPADFDGDGRTDISVFRPSNGVWYRLNSSNGAFAAVAFGLNGDSPVPSYYIQ